ncbi:hypothetical protein ACI2IP_06695 [Microbacterium sp. NPDC090218]
MRSRDGVDQLFAELEVECGVSVHGITDRVSVLRGIDVEVEVLSEDEWARVPRFVLVNGDRARIPLLESDPRWYRLHVVVHQLAHLLCGHTQCAALPMSFDDPREPADSDLLALDILRQQETEVEELARRLSAFISAPSPSPAPALLR